MSHVAPEIIHRRQYYCTLVSTNYIWLCIIALRKSDVITILYITLCST